MSEDPFPGDSHTVNPAGQTYSGEFPPEKTRAPGELPSILFSSLFGQIFAIFSKFGQIGHNFYLAKQGNLSIQFFF